jgi:hypothetical protein
LGIRTLSGKSSFRATGKVSELFVALVDFFREQQAAFTENSTVVCYDLLHS